MKLSLKSRLYGGYIYILFATLFITIIQFINFFNDAETIEVSNFIYYLCLNFGYASFYSIIIYLITYIPLALVTSSNRIPGLGFIIVAIVLQIFLTIDIYVFAIYKFHLSWSGLVFYWTMGQDIFVFERKIKILIALVLFFTTILPYLVVYFWGYKLSKYLRYKTINIIGLFFLTLFLGSNIRYIFARKYSEISIIKATGCIPIFPSKTIKNIAAQWKSPETIYIDEIMFDKPEGELNYPLSPIINKEIDKKYNIVVIMIDSWNIRTFDREVTPNIYKFAQSSQRFNQHYSGSHATEGSLFSMFYSLPHFSYFEAVEKNKTYPLLFTEMKKQGYNIDVFSSAYLVLQTTVFGGLEGIQVFTPGGSAYKQDINITERAVNFINNQDGSQPFFSLVFYDLAHAISIPEEHRTKFTPS